MREILFRGKRISDGKWVEGDLSHCVVVGETHIRRIEENLSTTTHRIDHETVCQYTGLTDKNGRKIFEGDIVGFEDCTSTESGYWEQYCSGEVKWSEEEAQFSVTNRLTAESYEVLQDCEIIGNIFDNPELIEIQN